VTEPAIFSQALAILAKEGVDPLKDSFADFAPIIRKRGAGKTVAVMLAAMFARKLATEHGAFWFIQRDAPLGAALGFPKVFFTFSPVTLTEATLAQGDVGALDTRERELRESLNKYLTPIGAEKLTPALYQELLDPGFVRFIVLDPARVEQALNMPAKHAVQELCEAIDASVSEPARRDSIDAMWLDPLEKLEGQVALREQIARAPRAIERFVHMFATVSASEPAAASFWPGKVFNSTLLEKGRVFGVFPLETTRPLMNEVEIPRVYLVDAEQLRGRLEGSDVSAEQWRAELRLLSHAKGALAFARATVADAAAEAAVTVEFAG
jgi:hypothetical protein